MFGQFRGGRGSSASDRSDSAPQLLARARAARREGQFSEAAELYEQVLALKPADARTRIQAAHMRKEAGELARAETLYLYAQRQLPNDPDCALQLGHFYKVAGNLVEAERWYRAASHLRRNWDEAQNELANLQRIGIADDLALAPSGIEHMDSLLAARMASLDAAAAEIRSAGPVARLVPKLAPRLPGDMLHGHHEHVEVRRLGRKEQGYWGTLRTLRGVEAVRGFCISETPIVELQIILNGVTIFRGPVRGGYVLVFERDKDRYRKYVFNEWINFSGFVPGLYAIELRLIDLEAKTQSFHDHAVIMAAVAEEDYPHSDALVNVDPQDRRSVIEQVRARPSMVRPARRMLFPDGIRNVLVMRTDQLGDMVASIPAMRRLRELVPGARIVGLLTGANADLARTLNLFDEVIVVDFPDDRVERRRLMPLDVQEALRERLEPYRFDIALDLAQSNVSRDLLPLTGARLLYGTGGEDWPWLSAEFIFNTRDRWNAMDTTPHSTKVLALVEALGAVLRNEMPVIKRDDLSRALLEPFGLCSDGRFALLHAGARIEFSRWPGYPALAERLLDQSDLDVVLMTEDPGMRDALPRRLIEQSRFHLIDHRLSFDQFDAFISYATVVVGNDSGPKHLAALRGTNVVTLFTARINWTEWAQENVGSVISRRVPCAGCAIFHDAEECGKDFACIRDIRVDEVFEATMRYV